MKVSFRNVNKMQAGGAAPAPEAAPLGAPMGPEAGAPAGGGEDIMMQLIQGAAQALQSQDCNMAMQVCQVLVQLAQGAEGGGAPAPEGGAPEGEPVYRRGGRLVRRIVR